MGKFRARLPASFALFGVVLALGSPVYAVWRINVESRARRDQACKQSEGRHLESVQKLAKTYEYLSALKPDERHSTLNVFVVRNLRDQEREAKADTAPPFCDEQGIGLPEPNPKFPKRPPAVDRLVKGQGK